MAVNPSHLCQRLKNTNKNQLNIMKHTLFCLPAPWRRATTVACGVLLGLLLTTKTHAQGEIPSGTISGSGAGPYNYALTFSDAAGATSPIVSVWYAWVPGQFYLPSDPTSASAPAGWTASIANNSIQFVADSAANDIAAGETLSGFGYQATFSPAELSAAPNSGVSVAYSGGLFSDGGSTFTVAPAPEPSAALLLIPGVAALWSVRRYRAERVCRA